VAVSQAKVVRFVLALVATMLLSAFMLMFGLVVLPFMALPVAFLLVRKELVSAAVVVASTGLVFGLAVSWTTAAIIALVLVFLGAAVSVSVRKRWSFKYSLFAVTAGALAILVGLLLLSWPAGGLHAYWTQTVNSAVASGSSTYRSMGVSNMNEVLNKVRWSMDAWLYLLPALLVVGALGLAGCVVGLVHLQAQRMRVEVPFSLSGFRLHWVTAYGTIVGLALVAYSTLTGTLYDPIGLVGLNLVFMVQGLFFYQGLAVTHWSAKRKQYKTGTRVLVYLLSVIFLPFTGILGLLDTWVNYRKRYAAGNPGAGSVG
jgi:hypothetical protein